MIPGKWRESEGETVSDQIVLHDATAGRWLRFRNPHQVVAVNALRDVLPALDQIETWVNKNRWYAAGFLTYEASSAFDSAIVTHKPGGLPLLWFGLYSDPEEIDLPEPDYSAYELGAPIPSVGLSEYRQAIQYIKDYIQAGDTYQVNYTIRMEMPFTGDAWHLFLAMVRAQSPGYAGWVDTGRYAICSASPELFFRLEKGALTCKPMKGTVRRGRTQAEDIELAEWLHQSEKNRAENLMIVDMIRNDLGRVAETGSVSVPQLFEVERHHTLWQMTSTVTAECRKSVRELFQSLFPCASITGAPKVRTTEIIAELEPTPRGVYTGCIGFISPENFAQFSVAIRTAVVDKGTGKAEYGAGGGIVWDSVADDEFKEALLKARVLTEQRPEFALLETILWTPEEGYFLLDYHMKRLVESADYFGYSIRPAEIRQKLEILTGEFSRSPQRIRCLLGANGDIRIESAELAAAQEKPVQIRIAAEPMDTLDIFLYHKTTHRSSYEKALRSCPACDDVLLWNERREITESTIANVVVEIDGELLTPPVNSGLLAGTFRASLLEQGIIHERVVSLEDLKRCSRIYLINSVRKWREARLSPESD